MKQIPGYGVGTAMRDPAAWLDEQATRPGAPALLRPVSELLRTTYGVDVAFLQKNLDDPASRFVELIHTRLESPAPQDQQPSG